MISGFKEFLLKNNILALAIAVIVGGAVGKVVTALVADIIMPLVSPLLPTGAWREAQIVLSRSIGPDGKEVVNAIKYGDFFGNIIDFLIIAFVIYLLTKSLLREKPVPVSTKDCPRCKEAIALAATKCKFCTADM